ncbi:hypothetical protein [Sciscionella marina]|uniref:hypothetical protein n=1 Tax=Sciscionella marina TaxID=508770 RepID=UPI0012F6FD9D|nr:hypothetical protein [Sciscionella marina]
MAHDEDVGGPVGESTKPPSKSDPPPGKQPIAEPHAVGPALHIDPVEAGKAITHLDNAIDALEEAYLDSYDMSLTVGPGKEGASAGFSTTAARVGTQKRTELLEDVRGLQAMRNELSTAMDSYRQTEQANTDDLRKPGR